MYIYIFIYMRVWVCVRKGERPGRGPAGRGDDCQEYGEEHQPEPKGATVCHTVGKYGMRLCSRVLVGS